MAVRRRRSSARRRGTKRKSPKRVAAGRKAARTRKRRKAARSAAAKRSRRRNAKRAPVRRRRRTRKKAKKAPTRRRRRTRTGRRKNAKRRTYRRRRNPRRKARRKRRKSRRTYRKNPMKGIPIIGELFSPAALTVLGGAALSASLAPAIVGMFKKHIMKDKVIDPKWTPLLNIGAGALLATIAGFIKPLRKYSTAMLLGPAIVELAFLIKQKVWKEALELPVEGYGGMGDYMALPFTPGMGDYVALPFQGYGDQAMIEAGELGGFGDQYMIEQGELGQAPEMFYKMHRTF